MTQTTNPKPKHERRRYGDDWPRRSHAPTVVPMPAIPHTASPTPWLTSIHATPGRGKYGDPQFRGNCSGLLIRDLLQFFRPGRVLDPMSGGGTCRDVCHDLGIPSAL